MLTGQGPYLAQQTEYDWGAYRQVADTAIRAWKALPKRGKGPASLTKIIQGPQQPFADFVARMSEAAGRIFGDTDAATPLVEQLVFEQAMPECQAAIAPRRNKGIQDWVRVCRELGGPLTNAGLAAAILQGQSSQRSKNHQKTCFNCGKSGHFKKDCRATQDTKAPSKLCSRCGKGYHWSSRCHSVRDIHGKLLPPLVPDNEEETKNGQAGPRFRGPKKAGAQTTFVKAQMETQADMRSIPQQGWTCVPPPTSY